jgi:hypothetical protein
MLLSHDVPLERVPLMYAMFYRRGFVRAALSPRLPCITLHRDPVDEICDVPPRGYAGYAAAKTFILLSLKRKGDIGQNLFLGIGDSLE